jgi:hypothetical protein
MQSAPGFHRFKTFTANINQEDRPIACFHAHIIPDDESLVQGKHLPEELGDPNQSALSNSTKGKHQTLDNQLTTPENGIETTVETPESLEAFKAGLHPTETLEAFEAGLPEEIPDQNPSATNSTPKNSATNTPENGMKPTIKNTEDCIETLQKFEDCLPQNDSQQEESQLDNLTHKLVQQHYKFHPQWMAKSGILPPTTPGHLQSATARGLLQWQCLQTNLARKGVSKKDCSRP